MILSAEVLSAATVSHDRVAWPFLSRCYSPHKCVVGSDVICAPTSNVPTDVTLSQDICLTSVWANDVPDP